MVRRSASIFGAVFALVCGISFLAPAPARGESVLPATTSLATVQIDLTSPLVIGQTATLTFTLHIPGSESIPNHFDFTGVLANVRIASPNGLSGSCGGGTLEATPLNNEVFVYGAELNPGGSCTFSVRVTAVEAGTQDVVGILDSDQDGLIVAHLPVTVHSVPTVSASLAASSIVVGETTRLTITLAEPDSTPMDFPDVNVSDILPAGFVVATPDGLSQTCPAGLVDESGPIFQYAPYSTVGLGSCSISFDVMATTPGVFTNRADAVSGSGPNQVNFNRLPDASITVLAAVPTISAAFSASSMTVGWAVGLTFTIANPSGNGQITGVGFTDTLPAGLSVSSGSAGACGGNVTRSAPAGIVLSGALIADGGSCVFSVMVTGTAAGVHTTTTGQVSSNESGAGGTATASIDVNNYASIAATFSPSAVLPGGTTQLTLTITNPAGNPDTLRFIGLTDVLPSGLTAAGAAATTTCGGSLTVTAPGTIALSAASVAVGSQCQFSVPVTAGAAGSYVNTVTATLGGFVYTGNTATAALQVAPLATAPPTATAGGEGPGGQVPAPLLLVLMTAAGLAAAGFSLRSRFQRRGYKENTP